MTSEEIRRRFLDFFSAKGGSASGGKARGHAIVPSSSLIPDDPSVLLTTAGMQQFKRYFTGELDAQKDFGSLSTASVQKCFRTSDIDEVGDETHLTFFEMLGNFSFGGYWKKEAIQYGHDFIVKEMELEIDYVTVFDSAKVPDSDWRKSVPFDKESFGIWQNLVPKEKIRREGVDNFWGPTGNEGPCGPTTEIYVNSALRQAQGKLPVEVWNIVFNQFYRPSMGSTSSPQAGSGQVTLQPLKIQGVDTGMGLERLAMVSQNAPTLFETDLFQSLIARAPQATLRSQRILADHARGVAFLIADGVRPSNKEAGYMLRRLMRRLIVHGENGGVQPRLLLEMAIEHYRAVYPELKRDVIMPVFEAEDAKFKETLRAGLKQLGKLTDIDASSAFKLYESYGIPFEVIKELGGKRAAPLTREAFDEEFKKHQEISRAGQEKKFGGHGLILNTGELKAGDEEELRKVLRLHTATHLLQAALRKVLGNEVQQRGSDITAERTRFDFSFPRKLTPEEIKNVEALVNAKIKEDLPVSFKEMSKAEAEKTGALHFFSAGGGSSSGGKEKYPERVKVYYVGRSLEDAWSKEFCGGPHVTHTGEIGSFRIVKEEAVGAGVRRIRGTVA